jgi:ketosteroid isomerase-like protein
MRTRIAFATILVAVFGGVQGRAAGAESPESKAVNAAFDRYIEGWQKGNIDILSGAYAHDARLTAYWPDPTRPLRLESWDTVRQNLKEVFDLIHKMELDFDQRQIDVYGNIAVVSSHWTWHHNAAGPFFEHGRATFIFRKDAGKWLIIHEHSSVTPFLPGGDSELLVKENSR